MHPSLAFKSLCEIYDLERTGKSSAYELLKELRFRIERLDSEIKSYVRLNPNVEEEFLKAMDKHPFLIPVSVKDLIDTKGLETNYGSPIYSRNVPTKDATLVENLKKNGGIILGKTVTHEFALGIQSSPTKNPWNLNRIPGGSSGGSAAAIAAGLSVFALGTDTGGSIRIPAAMCGVTGFKPTYDLVPRKGIFPESWSLDHAGPITRYAKDLKIEIELIAGRKLKQPSETNGKLKVGVAWELFDLCEKWVKNVSLYALEKVRAVLDIDFMEVDPSALMFEEMRHYQGIIDTCEIALIHKDLFKEYPEKYMNSSVEQIQEGQKIRGIEYLEAKRNRVKFKSKFNLNFKKLDIIITPALPKIAPLINETANGGNEFSKQFTRFLSPLNYSGNPALVIPIGLSQEMPVGIQIIAKSHLDNICIDFSSKIQEVTEWHKLIPPNLN